MTNPVPSKHTQLTKIGFLKRAVISICLLGSGFYAGHYLTGSQQLWLNQSFIKKWDANLHNQTSLVRAAYSKAQAELNALTLRLADLQARLVKLDAVGKHVIELVGLDDGEFDFSAPPVSVDGPGVGEEQGYTQPDFMSAVEELMTEVQHRTEELKVLESLVDKRKIRKATFIAGRPIKKGWLTSRFGARTDPFTGKRKMHSGIDFADKANTEILSVAAGVVTKSDARAGYGRSVEVTHSSGYQTRYSHNSRNLVEVGDIVRKGEVIALMGSSGRSTGPHVHFEVIKDGNRVDPAAYIQRTPQ